MRHLAQLALVAVAIASGCHATEKNPGSRTAIDCKGACADEHSDPPTENVAKKEPSDDLPPASVPCDKLQELADKETEGSTGKTPFKLSREKCLKNMNEMKARDRNAYRCTVEALPKAPELDLAFAAILECDKNKPKPKTEPDE